MTKARNVEIGRHVMSYITKRGPKIIVTVIEGQLFLREMAPHYKNNFLIHHRSTLPERN